MVNGGDDVVEGMPAAAAVHDEEEEIIQFNRVDLGTLTFRIFNKNYHAAIMNNVINMQNRIDQLINQNHSLQQTMDAKETEIATEQQKHEEQLYDIMTISNETDEECRRLGANAVIMENSLREQRKLFGYAKQKLTKAQKKMDNEVEDTEVDPLVEEHAQRRQDVKNSMLATLLFNLTHLRRFNSYEDLIASTTACFHSVFHQRLCEEVLHRKFH